MEWVIDIVSVIIPISFYGSLLFIFYDTMKCHHHWVEVETLKGEYKGKPYVIKVMKCPECGKIKKIKLV